MEFGFLLNKAGFFAQTYADDILILVKADDEHVLVGLMQHALGIMQACCESVRLSVNPDKANMILFTTRYKVKSIRGVQLGGKPLKLVKEAKRLRMTLDSKLNWGKHINKICEKAINTFWACRRAFGNTWDLSPGNVRRMYIAIIRPRFTSGGLVAEVFTNDPPELLRQSTKTSNRGHNGLSEHHKS